MRTTTLIALVAALMLGAIGLAACGDDDTASPPPAATESARTDTTGEEEMPQDDLVVVAADPDGEQAYLQDSLRAQAGKVRFEFTNEADIPHDFNIEQDGEQVDGTEVITQSEEDLTVDLEPGEYTYYCSVANHREEGMEGELTVE
ncbi:MAG: cupredoxin domain-containing protein [Actinobacteria bacterium]|nr:cupredoxin domain-containing protein [Actinomycetota bacterium]